MTQQKKIRVLQGIRQGKIGGGESVLLSLVENINREIFEPVVLSFTGGPMVETIKKMGIAVHVIYTEKPFDFTVWGKVRQLMINEKIDIVHAHGTRAASNMYRAAHKQKLPFIYTCHGWSFHQDQKPLVKRIRIMSEKFLTKRTTLNICVSESNCAEGKKLFGNGFNPEVILNSVDTRKFNPNKEFKDIRKEFGIGPAETLFVSVARFTWQKQPVALIRSFIEVLKQTDHVKLLMVGDGEQKEEAIELIRKSGVEGKIILETFRKDVPDILAAADVFVLPSLWEGLPVALLEAMAMGKAIIASRVDGTAEVLEDGKTGVLIDTDGLEDNLVAAILRLNDDKELRQTLGCNALKRIKEHYSIETMTHRNEDIYKSVYVQK